MSSFFLSSSSSSKGKGGRVQKRTKQQKDTRKRKVKKLIKRGIREDTKKRRKREEKEEEDNPHISDDDNDEEIPSDDNEDKSFHSLAVLNEELSEGEETAPEKRLRLAKDYLSQLKAEDEDEIDNDAIAQRLHEEVLEKAGRLHKRVADQYSTTGHTITFYKGHKLSITSLVITPDDQYVFTGSKDGSIIKWNIDTGRKEIIISSSRKKTNNRDECTVGHTGHVLALAISSDGHYLVSGGTDNIIHVWNPLTCVHLHTFRGHKAPVSGLVFQYGTHEMFSASFDRSVKVWNLDEMTYVETLFGHQDGVVAIDCLSQERPVTCGVDKTLRVWKIIDESQLVFHGHKSSIDTVKFIDEKNFISGSQDGVALWNVTKKKPHVIKRHSSLEEGRDDLWVTAVSGLPYTDLVASGSRDGNVQFWKCGESYRTLEHLFTVSVPGFVNCLSFCKEGNYCVAGIGQEHRLGRWWKDTNTKNGIVIIKLNKEIQ